MEMKSRGTLEIRCRLLQTWTRAVQMWVSEKRWSCRFIFKVLPSSTFLIPSQALVTALEVEEAVNAWPSVELQKRGNWRVT